MTYINRAVLTKKTTCELKAKRCVGLVFAVHLSGHNQDHARPTKKHTQTNRDVTSINLGVNQII